MSNFDSSRKFSYLSGGSQGYIDALYEQYLVAPADVPDEWRQYFESLGHEQDVAHAPVRAYFENFQTSRGSGHQKQFSHASASDFQIQANLTKLINAYREHGHHHAQLDPLGMSEKNNIPDLELSCYGFSSSDLQQIHVQFDNALVANGATLQDLYQALRRTYCGSIGVELSHINDHDQKEWLQSRIEKSAYATLSPEQKKSILKHLTAGEGLEKYLGAKYVGQKRFSLEGCESLIPMMHHLINCAGTQEVKEIIIGMAHRGRLNVLVNVLGKTPESLFQEFEGKTDESKLSGDVKYHQGFSANIIASGNEVHLALAFNPSHLEIIAPVVEGSVRARQRRRADQEERRQVIPVIMHGDSAFCGQGVVMETMNFSQVRGYSTGGTLHIIINNQVGFTTSNQLDTRSTLYSSDIAKSIQAPIFHVNADDPEAVLFVTELAYDYRMQFKRDVVVDLVCYRRHGHNEADDPSVTQPMMYQVIKSLPTTRQIYAEKLQAELVVDKKTSEQYVQDYRDMLDKGETVVKAVPGRGQDKASVDWSLFLDREWTEPCDTTVTLDVLQSLNRQLSSVDASFNLQPVVKRLLDDRNKMSQGELPVNWGYAETLAFASLLHEGYGVRLSGQDCGRGTFAHRHAVLHDAKTGKIDIPLSRIASSLEQFSVIDSTLSEEGVLGFEYGFATAEPNALTIWEAQFGDFANGAQVVIDQFISSGEQKWGRLCGLVMLLPHGFEGQGPEHSSARLERYLQLCAQHNMQVCVPTTPAQAFHMFRRQMVRLYRKPLIVMTPKSLLRHKMAVSSLKELTEGEFKLIIPEIEEQAPEKVNRVVLCSGKVYYDLLKCRQDNKLNHVAIIRVEQLYPFPEQVLTEELHRYSNAKQVVWCQEEPQNQGAWYSSQHHMKACLRKGQKLRYAGRGQFASTAVGSSLLHKKQQDELVLDALT